MQARSARWLLWLAGPALVAMAAASRGDAQRDATAQAAQLAPARVAAALAEPATLPEPAAPPALPALPDAPRDDDAAAHPMPAWARGGVVYGVVPRLFGERPFRDVTRRLDDLYDLGAAAIWLAPVTRASDPDDFGYAVTDHFAVRGEYGTEDELRTLVREAHARGIRVLLDVVPNHTSTSHRWFRDAEGRGAASPFFDFYDRDEDGDPTHYFDWEHLPNLNYDNPVVADTIVQSFRRFTRDFDVDGFRVDAAWGVRERSPGFFPRLAAALRAERPDAFLLAEASAHDEGWLRAGFDAVYDWSAEKGHWAWEHAFDDPSRTGARLYEALAEGRTPPSHVARFLNNNDTAARFVSRWGVPAVRTAAALLLTLPGVPVVYTGDEVGAEYEPYDDVAPLAFVDRHGLREHYRRLVHLRAELPALGSPDWTPIATPEQPAVLAYVRHEPSGASPALVVLDFGDAARARVAVPPRFARLARGGSLWDALHGQPVRAERAPDGSLLVPRGPDGARVLVGRP